MVRFIHSSKGLKFSLIVAISILIMVGILTVFSSTYIFGLEKYGDQFYFLKRHIIFLFIGLFIFVIIQFIDIEVFKKLNPFLVIITILLLLLTLIPGLGVKVYGATRWLKFPLIGRFQTSELAKVVLIFFLANYYSKFSKFNFKDGVLKPFPVWGLILFLILLQPDFSTVMLLGIFIFVFMFVGGVSFINLLGLGLLGALLGGLVIYFSPYRLKRFVAFLDPWKDPKGTGFQIIQSYIAIYRGKLFGVGIGNSTQKLFYLPEAHNDFILSVIVEEAGSFWTILLLLVYLLILYLGFKIAVNLSDKFLSLLAFGITFLLGLQVIFNISVVVGLFPVTGIPLPLISYGGTSLIITLFLLGILVKLANYVEV